VFVEAGNNRDPDTLASIFDADAEFVNVTGLWWHNRESIIEAHAYGLEHIFDRSTLHLVRTKVKGLTDDVAVVHARMRLSGQRPVGEVAKPQTRQNIFSFVVHRVPEGWSCASAHNTDVIPHMKANVVEADGQLRSVNYRRRGSTR
jgi:uncharacterized protein (TIGR02246 family)